MGCDTEQAAEFLKGEATMTKMYYIVDMQGNYYKIGAKGNLMVAKNSDEADVFTLRDANDRIDGGRKARFYTTVEATETVIPVEETVYDAPEYDVVDKPTMFDSLQNNWEELLSNLCYVSSHMDEYQNNLNQMLSDVDKEICDLMHYLEFSDLDNQEMLKVAEMLKDRRQHRRQIKDEMEKTALMKDTFLDRTFGTKVQQSLDVMERMKTRQYTPRRLNELFEQQRASA